MRKKYDRLAKSDGILENIQENNGETDLEPKSQESSPNGNLLSLELINFLNSHFDSGKPRLVGAKRKIDGQLIAAQSPGKPHTPNKAQTPLHAKLATRFKRNIIKSPNACTPASKIPVLAKINESPLTPIRKVNDEAENMLPKTPPIPTKKAKTTIKSPLSDFNAKHDIRYNAPSTPLNQKIECTPKKSLFKRLLESATPSKAHNPRTITSATTKNFTSTHFIDPEHCINILIKSLEAKGIICKKKE